MLVFSTWMRRLPAGVREDYGPVEIPDEVLHLPPSERAVEIMSWSWNRCGGLWPAVADGYNIPVPVFNPGIDAWEFVAENRYASYQMVMIGPFEPTGPW